MDKWEKLGAYSSCTIVDVEYILFIAGLCMVFEPELNVKRCTN